MESPCDCRDCKGFRFNGHFPPRDGAQDATSTTSAAASSARMVSETFSPVFWESAVNFTFSAGVVRRVMYSLHNSFFRFSILRPFRLQHGPNTKRITRLCRVIRFVTCHLSQCVVQIRSTAAHVRFIALETPTISLPRVRRRFYFLSPLYHEITRKNNHRHP